MSKHVEQALAAPFAEKDLKHRPGRGGLTFTYADARAVAQRLDDVLGILGWQFEVKVVDLARGVVLGSLTIIIDGKVTIREDIGYPNSAQDDEPLKSATSDALRRCAAQVGVGRSLYSPDKGVGGIPTPSRLPARPSVAEIRVPEASSGLTEDQIVAAKAAMLFAADSADGECSHGTAWTLKPGGIAKVSGKPYQPFWTASHKMPDGGFCKDKPSLKWLAAHPPTEPNGPKEDLESLPF